MAVKTGGGSSQPSDFSKGSSTIHPILTTKTIGSIPTKVSFLGKSVPKGNQGSLIHRISRVLGTIENPKRESGSATPRENHNDIITNLTSCSNRHTTTMTATTNFSRNPDPVPDPPKFLIFGENIPVKTEGGLNYSRIHIERTRLNLTESSFPFHHRFSRDG